MKGTLISFLLIIFTSPPSLSQTDSGKNHAEWEVCFTAGFFTGGPAKGMNTALLDAGYDYKSAPENSTPKALGIYRSLNKSFRLGLNVAMLYQSLKTETDHHFCRFNTITFNPTLSYSLKGLAFIEAGPSLNSIAFLHSTNSSLENDVTHFKPGFIVRTGLEYPKKTLLRLRVEMQYCYGSTIDPVFSIESRQMQYFFTHVQTKLPVHYVYFGIGLGLRI
jgi:hypothetical protein